VAQSIAEGNVRLHGLQGEIDRLHREIAALGAVNLAALEELQPARAQDLPRRADGRPDRP
jgi:chromosome segregation protein